MNRLLSKLGTQSAAGGTVLPLSSVLFVDARNEQSSPDGSIGNPFTTIQPALTLFETLAAEDGPLEMAIGVSVLVVPADYSGETLVYEGGPQLSISNIEQRARVQQNGSPAKLGPLTADSGVCLNGVNIQSVDGGFGGVWLQNCDSGADDPILVTCNGGVIYADNTLLWQVVTLHGVNVVLRGCELLGVTVEAEGSAVEVTNTVWTVGGLVAFETPTGEGPPNVLKLDSLSLWHWQQMGVAATVTNGEVFPMLPVPP